MFKVFFIFSLIVIQSLISAQESCGTAGSPTPFIVNGSPSEQGAWPWIVALHTTQRNQFFCGATLIASKIVVTAGHCMQPKDNLRKSKPLHPTEFVVKLGKYDLSLENERGSLTNYPDKIIIHPDWQSHGEKFEGDIAMILLETRVIFSSTVSPICLWSQTTPPQVKKGIVVGWGKSESAAQHENKPRELEVFIRTNEECFLKEPRLGTISTFNTFCAGKDATSGPCKGDSGSGLFIKIETGSISRWYLNGIVSAGFIEKDTCDVSVDVIFSNVVKYQAWIVRVAVENAIKLPSPSTSSIAAASGTMNVQNNKEIFCYFESWAKGRAGEGSFTLNNLKPALCTTLVFLHAELDVERDSMKSINPGQDLQDNGGENLYKRFTGLKKKHPHLKTLLSIGSWNEGSVVYSELAGDPNRRNRFAKNSANYLKKFGFDGLHFHWEHPGQRGGSSDDKENFVLLLQEIKTFYKPRNLFLSAMVRPQNYVVDSSYDLPNIAMHVDAIMIMTFDMTGPWNEKVGYASAVRANGDDSVENRVNYFLSLGVPANKLIVGIPFHGRTFVTENDGDIGDKARNYGFAGPFFSESGFLGYNEFCSMNKNNKFDITYDTETSQAIGKFTQDGLTNVVTFDSARGVANKAKLIIDQKLGGAWVWFVDADDWRGDCPMDSTTFADFPNPIGVPRRERDYPLLRTVNEAFKMLQ